MKLDSNLNILMGHIKKGKKLPLQKIGKEKKDEVGFISPGVQDFAGSGAWVLGCSGARVLGGLQHRASAV